MYQQLDQRARGQVAAAADRENYGRISADIERAEAHVQQLELQVREADTRFLQSEARLREAKVAIDELQKAVLEVRQSVPGIVLQHLRAAFSKPAKGGA